MCRNLYSPGAQGAPASNNIELSENTFRFHLKLLLEKHGGLFESMIARIGRENVLENLCVIYQELEPSNFGRIMAYLTLVFKVSDFCEPEIVQEAVKICVWELKQVDSASFEIKQSWMQRLIQYGMSVIAMAHVPCIATQVGAQLGAQIFKFVHQI